jgi:hypothetical protein
LLQKQKMFSFFKPYETALSIRFLSFSLANNPPYALFQSVKYNFSTNVARLDDAASAAADENAQPTTEQKEQKKLVINFKIKRKTPNHPTIVVDSTLVGSQIVDPRGRLPKNVDVSTQRHFQITGKRRKSY